MYVTITANTIIAAIPNASKIPSTGIVGGVNLLILILYHKIINLSSVGL